LLFDVGGQFVALAVFFGQGDFGRFRVAQCQGVALKAGRL
jgi:hypothetical protein